MLLGQFFLIFFFNFDYSNFGYLVNRCASCVNVHFLLNLNMQITGPENVKIQLIKVNYLKITYRLRFVKKNLKKKKRKRRSERLC